MSELSILEKRQLIAKGAGIDLLLGAFDLMVHNGRGGQEVYHPDKDANQLLQAIEVLSEKLGGLDIILDSIGSQWTVKIDPDISNVRVVEDGLHNALFNALVNYLMEKS